MGYAPVGGEGDVERPLEAAGGCWGLLGTTSNGVSRCELERCAMEGRDALGTRDGEGRGGAYVWCDGQRRREMARARLEKNSDMGIECGIE